MFLLAAAGTTAIAQDYVAPQVTVSKEKVRYGGKVYYSHIVLERQTLFSIAKAYGVTVQDIYDTNPTLNLEKEGLKKNQILLIPVKDGKTVSAEETVKENKTAEPQKTEPQKAETKKQKKGGFWDTITSKKTEETETANSEYFLHTVKWFEDLGSIASKYKVSEKSIMNINGLTSREVKRKQTLKIPYHPEKWENISASPSAEEARPQEKEQATTSENADNSVDSTSEGSIFNFGKHDVGISMLLPINSKDKADQLILDFYCGALMAARDLGKDGTDIDLSVYDVGGGSIPATRERFAASDFTIGPVSNTDISNALEICQGTGWIVSPLDPKAESLVNTVPNLIQAPTPVNVQIQDMIDWIRSDSRSGDKVILVTQKGATETDYASSVIKAVETSGLAHSTLSFSILEGRSILNSLTAMMAAKGTTRIIIASDSEAFAIEVVRNLYLLSKNGTRLALYSTSKIRSFDTIDLEQLHNVNLHVSTSYYVDYDSDEVKRFLLDYRALYNAEPSQFSFQGYDLMKCLSTLASRYGKKWEKHLDDVRLQGMQADFKFVRTAENGGYVNKAVRRLEYRPDYSIRLVR